MKTIAKKSVAAKSVSKKPVAKAAAVKKSVAKAAAPKKTAKVVAIRARGEKWEMAKKLLTAKGGTPTAALFEVLKWRSMDRNILLAKCGLTVTKLESGNYHGKAA